MEKRAVGSGIVKCYRMKAKIPAYEDIVKFNYWQPPQPSSLMLTFVNRYGEKIKIDFLPDIDDDNDYPIDLMRPKYIHLNGSEHKAELQPEEIKKILKLLKRMIKENKLGHHEGCGVRLAMEMITYFDS